MAYNNRLLHTCLCLCTHETLFCALVDTKTCKIVVSRQYSPIIKNGKQGSYDSVRIIGYIKDFLKEYAIGGTILLHVVFDEPVSSTRIYHDDLYQFARLASFQLNKVRIDSVADILAYRQWNLLGLKLPSEQKRRAWAQYSRISLIFASENQLSLSLVDNGNIIQRLSLDPYQNIVRDATLSNAPKTSSLSTSNPFMPMKHSAVNVENKAQIPWSDAVEQVSYLIYGLTHASQLFFYANQDTKIDVNAAKTVLNQDFSLTMLDTSKTSLLQDVAEGIIMKDSMFEGEHYFMKVLRPDYRDLSITVLDDDGQKQSMPVFQH